MNKDKKPLSITHPEIAAQAYGWDPTKMSAGSGKKLTWRCKFQHEWIVSISSRTSQKTGCPICSNKKVVEGINDLATTHPELAKEAFGWDPTKKSYGSSSKVEWQCEKGHVWKTTISHRSNTTLNTGCPVCKNQKLLEGYNDLATTHPELAKEAFGWDPTKVIAGTNKKLEWICNLGHVWTSPVATRSKKDQPSGCPICSNKKVAEGINDLATTHPELAKEAFGWDPTKVTAGTRQKLEWKCSLGHTWKSGGYTRIKGHGCPVCFNKSAHKGYNDLATTHPELAKEAFGWDPTKVIAGTNKKLEWICNLGHVWRASGNKRVYEGTNCAICSGRQVLIGFNDLSTLFPNLAKEAYGWDPGKVLAGTHSKKQWKCQQGHIWTTSVANRKRTGCPSCTKHGFDPNDKGYIYFLIQQHWEIYQIGITNNPKDRLSRHRKNGFELIELRGPMDGRATQELETALLSYLKSQKADLSPDHMAGKFDGYSESWTIDSFKVNNLKELIDKASEAGF